MAYPISIGTHVRGITDPAHKLGVDLPTSFPVALAAAEQLRRDTLDTGVNLGHVTARAVELIKSGKDWREDKQLQSMAITALISTEGLAHAGAQEAEVMAVEAVRNHADEILATFADAVADDVETLTLAAPRLKDCPTLADPDFHLLRQRNLLTAYGEAVDAAERINEAIRAWGAIATLLRIDRAVMHRPLELTDAEPALVSQISNDANHIDVGAWTLVRGGASLALLDSVGSYHRRVRGYTALHQQRYQEREEAKRRHGFDGPVGGLSAATRSALAGA